ncbi:hypothetical protein AA11825_1319 [Acetobacter pomorum DSM 11825]|nr:hypothetical protein AA11825_1319 [Acetobacter pomorum DSM 11825]
MKDTQKAQIYFRNMPLKPTRPFSGAGFFMAVSYHGVNAPAEWGVRTKKEETAGVSFDLINKALLFLIKNDYGA